MATSITEVGTVDLTPSQRLHLQACEAVIEKGIKTFVAVGKALSEIRDDRLYLETHTSFEAYAKERWNLTRPRAYQLMDHSKTVEAITEGIGLSTKVDIPETQTRKIKPVVGLVKTEVKKRVDAGEDPTEVVQDVVQAAARQVSQVRTDVVELKKGFEDVPEDAEPEEEVDTAGLMDSMKAEILHLQDANASLASDDLAKELSSWTEKYWALEGRYKQELSVSKVAQDQASYGTRKLKQIRAALEVESDKEILPAIDRLKNPW